MELTPFGQFSAIDENAIFNGSPFGGKLLRTSASRTESPFSDLNPAPPISLPDLRPVKCPNLNQCGYFFFSFLTKYLQLNTESSYTN